MRSNFNFQKIFVLFFTPMFLFALLLMPSVIFSQQTSKEVGQEDKKAKEKPSEAKPLNSQEKTLPADTKAKDELPPSQNSKSPTGVIQTYEKDVKEVVTKYKGKTDSASVKSKTDEILIKVRQFFDFSELAKLSLGPTWDKITPKERSEYNNVFRQLIERSYVSKSDKLIGDYDVKYLSEEITSNTATVNSSVIKEDADVDIKYKMHLKPDGWMIFNIIVDTTDLVKNYNSQFNSIISKEGFSGLMKRMKNKLTEHEDDVS